MSVEIGIDRGQGFPVSAGIDPGATFRYPQTYRFPRKRGDRPFYVDLAESEKEVSP